MILRWILWLLFLWWAGRLLGRLWRAQSNAARRRESGPAESPGAQQTSERSEFTQQEISDADYEEIK